MGHSELEADVIRARTVNFNAVIFVLAATCAITATILLIKFGEDGGRVVDYATYLYLAAAALGGVAYWHYQSQKRRLSLHRTQGVHTLEIAGSVEEQGPFEIRFGYADYRPAGRRSARIRRMVLCIDKDERTICTLEETGNPNQAPPRGWPEGWPQSDGGQRFHVAGGRPILVELRRRLDAGAVDDGDGFDDGVISEGDVAALVKMFNKRD